MFLWEKTFDSFLQCYPMPVSQDSNHSLDNFQEACCMKMMKISRMDRFDQKKLYQKVRQAWPINKSINQFFWVCSQEHKIQKANKHQLEWIDFAEKYKKHRMEPPVSPQEGSLYVFLVGNYQLSPGSIRPFSNKPNFLMWTGKCYSGSQKLILASKSENYFSGF